MDSTYAPQSPDLSGFLTSPSKQPQPHPHTTYHQPPIQSDLYAPRSPDLSSFTSQSPSHYRPLQAFQSPQSNHHSFASDGHELGGYNTTQYMPQIPDLPSSHTFDSPAQPQSLSNYYPQPQSHNQPRLYQDHIKSEGGYNSLSTTAPYAPPPSDAIYTQPPTMSSRVARQARGIGQASASSAPLRDPNPTNIEIKTKFPVARIKRIMQADEEVGKVAQVTPVAVSKALELFMIALVSGAAERAKEKGGKRVTAQHLKQVVMGSPEQFDFLNDIVGRVNEVQEGAGGEGRKKRVKEEGSEDSEEEKKPKKGKGRRKKNEA